MPLNFPKLANLTLAKPQLTQPLSLPLRASNLTNTNGGTPTVDMRNAGVGVGNGFGGGGSFSRTVISTFTPPNIGNLKVWYKSDTGVILSTASFAGTGTVTQVGNDITGVGTAFLSELVVGDAVSGVGISGTITAIADNTHCTSNASDAGAGVVFNVVPTAGTTDRVSSVADQSGAGITLTNATSSARPVFKSNIAAGRGAFLFDGVNDSLWNAAGVLSNQIATMFVVVKAWGGNSATMFSQSNRKFTIQRNGTGGFINYASATHNHFNAGYYTDANINLLVLINDGTNITERANGVQKHTAADGATGSASTGTSIGSDLSGADSPQEFGSGYFFEGLLYSGALSAVQITQVETYLNQRWSIF